MMDVFRNVHAALDDPVKVAAFKTDFEKRMQSYAKTYGTDYVADPMNQLQSARRVTKTLSVDLHARQRIVSPDARVLPRRVDAKTGQPTPLGKGGEFVGRVVLPITTIPMNILREALLHVGGGLFSAGGRLAAKTWQEGSFTRAVEKLSPQEADIIVRHLKKGLSGAAFMALGYFNPGAVGGFYQANRKRDENEVEYGGARIGGLDIPHWMLHNPLFLAMQFGATVRHVQDSYLRKHDVEPQGLPEGIFAASVGMLENVPGVQEMFKLSQARQAGKASDVAYDELTSAAVPGMVQDVARWLDKDSSGQPVRRDPRGLLQHTEMQIPGLRKTVPEKHEKKWWE